MWVLASELATYACMCLQSSKIKKEVCLNDSDASCKKTFLKFEYKKLRSNKIQYSKNVITKKQWVEAIQSKHALRALHKVTNGVSLVIVYYVYFHSVAAPFYPFFLSEKSKS